MSGRLADDVGAGTVTVLGTALLGVGLLLAVAGLGQAAVTGAAASGAADLAALAASDARRGITVQEPCALAGQVAERNGARLTDCSAAPEGSMRVEVALERAPLPTARATAVAGSPGLR